jgi:hypothetical protein
MLTTLAPSLLILVTALPTSLPSLYSNREFPPLLLNLKKINPTTIANFINLLYSLNWNNVLVCDDVNVAFDQFWQDFSTLYDINFPLQSTTKNRNIHKLNNYMTAGLLSS